MAEESICIKLCLFSTIRDAVGQADMELNVTPGTTALQIMADIVAMNPDRLKGLPIRMALNQEYISEDATLKHGDELALIPPVSGG
jgi:molybdopterin synthase catalytic subunit